MTTPRWMITSLLALMAPLGLLACDGDEGDADDEAADASDESTGGETDTEGESDETLGRTDAEVGGDLDVDADGVNDFGEADTDEPMGCAAKLTLDECNNSEGCASAFGTAILSDGADGWCSAPEDEFIGCVASGSLCPPLEQTVCNGDQMWTTSNCVPEALTICEPPGDITDICA